LADIFLKIEGIKGESLDSKHKDEIELVAFSWGLSHVGGAPGGGGGGGKAQFQDFHFTMRVNKASPQLFLTCASGKHIKEANVSVRRAQPTPIEYLKIKFTDVLVTSFEEAAGGGDAPQEMVAFNFDKIAVEYTPQSPSGVPGAVIKAGWDLSKNLKI
jgi:type VI secretion system secreted protein Hcp